MTTVVTIAVTTTRAALVIAASRNEIGKGGSRDGEHLHRQLRRQLFDGGHRSAKRGACCFHQVAGHRRADIAHGAAIHRDANAPQNGNADSAAQFRAGLRDGGCGASLLRWGATDDDICCQSKYRREPDGVDDKPTHHEAESGSVADKGDQHKTKRRKGEPTGEHQRRR